MKFSMNELKNR